MLDNLRNQVAQTCRLLPQYGLASFAWGSVSGIDRDNSLVVIKPHGVTFFEITTENLVVTDLTGHIVEGSGLPSVDLGTHLALYHAFPGIGGIVHTHSHSATVWAQSGRDIPPYGVTHAEYFRGYIPCTRSLTPSEIENDYEKNVALSIVEAFEKRGFDPSEIPGALVFNHGPFAWGETCQDALKNVAILENIAGLAYHTEQINPEVMPINNTILDQQFQKYHNLKHPNP